MVGFLEQIGIELPVVQAGMGGGLAGHELAAAVSAAGGLGTIGILGPSDLRAEITAARRLTDRPLAVNLLLPSPVALISRRRPRPRSSSPSGADRDVGPRGPGSTSAAPSRRRSRRTLPGPTR